MTSVIPAAACSGNSALNHIWIGADCATEVYSQGTLLQYAELHPWFEVSIPQKNSLSQEIIYLMTSVLFSFLRNSCSSARPFARTIAQIFHAKNMEIWEKIGAAYATSF
jgi:hypothetical protein